MSFAISFRKRSGLDLFGKPIYANGSFYSGRFYNKFEKAFVRNAQFSVPLEVEVLQSAPTKKVVTDFFFEEVTSS